MQTRVVVDKHDSGTELRLARGDMLEVILPEPRVIGHWTAAFDPQVISRSQAGSGEDSSCWVLDDGAQRSVRTFEALAQGRTSLKLEYLAEDTPGQVLDRLEVSVVVGNPPRRRRARERMPFPERVLMQLAVLALSGLLFVTSYRFTMTVFNLQGMGEERLTDLWFGASLGLLSGTVTCYALIKIGATLVGRR